MNLSPIMLTHTLYLCMPKLTGIMLAILAATLGRIEDIRSYHKPKKISNLLTVREPAKPRFIRELNLYYLYGQWVNPK